MNQSKNTHLSKDDVIKNGSIYTPQYLVDLVYSQIINYIDKETVISDFCSGYGVFIEKFQIIGKYCFGTEIDEYCCEKLKIIYPSIKIFKENSLINVSREKYGLESNEKLVIIGNPPYNDTTSQYKKNQKGVLNCDSDLISRDFGISFLKAYNKLNAEFICVLHPLTYLIKKVNFNSLGSFKDNYKLIDATIFSSKEFIGIKKTNLDFPVVSALYKKDNNGMDYNYIKNFSFSILNSLDKLVLNKITTIDGYVQKYPFKSKINGLQFYTLRDINALLRNTAFCENKSNGIKITDETLYQYCWLYFFKNNFSPPKNKFVYGNLSPLYTDKLNNKDFKNSIVSYTYNNCELLHKYYSKEKIESLYGCLTTDYTLIFEELNRIVDIFN